MIKDNENIGPKRRGRQQVLDPQQRRKQILDALDRTYGEGGTTSLTMSAVARSARMSTRTLYEVFADRSALFIAYFDRLSPAFIRDLTEAQKALPLDSRLTGMLEPRGQLETDLPHEILRCIVAEAPERPDVGHQFVEKFRNRALRMIRTELDRAVGSQASLLTVPTTHASATTQLPTAVRMPSSRPAKTPNRGRPSPRVRWPETRPCELRNTLAARSGETGADTTDEAASRRRCTV